MKSKILSVKKQVGTFVLCGALVTAIGVGTALAATPATCLQVKMKDGVKTYSTDGGKTWTEKVPDGMTISEKDGQFTLLNGTPLKDADGWDILVKMKDGVRTFSTDGGETWTEKAPDGVTINEKDGKFTILNGTPLKDADGQSILVKMKDGVRTFSTDGGETWTEKAPDGVTINEKDGKFTILNGTPLKDADGQSILVKMKDGVRTFSTDGGETWTEKVPDGMTISEKDGQFTLLNGTPLKDADGQGILVKMKDGVRTFSTDGGETWTEKAPDGAEDTVTIED